MDSLETTVCRNLWNEYATSSPGLLHLAIRQKKQLTQRYSKSRMSVCSDASGATTATGFAQGPDDHRNLLICSCPQAYVKCNARHIAVFVNGRRALGEAIVDSQPFAVAIPLFVDGRRALGRSRTETPRPSNVAITTSRSEWHVRIKTPVFLPWKVWRAGWRNRVRRARKFHGCSTAPVLPDCPWCIPARSLSIATLPPEYSLIP